MEMCADHQDRNPCHLHGLLSALEPTKRSVVIVEKIQRTFLLRALIHVHAWRACFHAFEAAYLCV
eukprot:SAG31_NODE_1106_length_9878_cov_4.621331_12_plen_65_part_00